MKNICPMCNYNFRLNEADLEFHGGSIASDVINCPSCDVSLIANYKKLGDVGKALTITIVANIVLEGFNFHGKWLVPFILISAVLGLIIWIAYVNTINQKNDRKWLPFSRSENLENSLTNYQNTVVGMRIREYKKQQRVREEKPRWWKP